MRWKAIVGTVVIISAAAVAVVVFAPPPGGSAPVPGVEPARGTDAGGAPGTAALRATIDPETGALEVGTAPVSARELDAAAQNALRRDTEGLIEERHPDGSVSVNLQGRFQSVSVVHRDENGTVTVCTDHESHAERVLEGRAAPEVK